MRLCFPTFAAALAVILPLVTPAGSAAQDVPADVLLERLLEEAARHNPELTAAAEVLSAAQARPAQAGALPEPMVSLGYVNDGWAPTLGEREMTTLGLMASQDLPWPGKRSLRTRIAARDADVAAQQLARARLGVTAAVRRAYHALQLARVRLQIAREQSELGSQVEAAARARYAVGQGAQVEVLRALVEATRVGQVESDQRAEEAVRVAELNRLLGRSAEAPVETAALALRPVRETLEAVLERLRTLSPERAAAQVSVERARLSVELARRDFRPDFTVQAGYMNRGGLDPMWQAGVGIRLPTARARRQAALSEAEASLRAAEARAASVDLQLRFRTQERLARLAALEQTSALYARGVVPQDQLAVQASLAGYQAGRAPLLAALGAVGTLQADRATAAALEAAHAQLRATLEEASLDAVAEMPATVAPMAGALSVGAPAMQEPAMPARPGGATASGTAASTGGMER